VGREDILQGKSKKRWHPLKALLEVRILHPQFAMLTTPGSFYQLAIIEEWSRSFKNPDRQTALLQEISLLRFNSVRLVDRSNGRDFLVGGNNATEDFALRTM